MRIFRTLLLPASEIIDVVCETIHYPFVYAVLYFLLSRPWKPPPQPPIKIDDGFPKTERRDIKELVDRLTGDREESLTQGCVNCEGGTTISKDNPYIEKEPTKVNFAINDAANDLICPLTLQLPFHPVTCEDGQVYERDAIDDYFKNYANTDDNLVLSPVTHELMGLRYLPAPQYKNIIETLIKNGVITGTLAEKWEERALHQKHIDDMLEMAQQGDRMEMLSVACNYLTGEGDFKEDADVAFQWFEKAHVAGSPIGTAGVGLMLTRGVGTAKDPEKGLKYLSEAGKRSDFAALILGLAYADGKIGFTINAKEAVHWLERCLDNSCAQRHMTEADKCMAQQKLDEVLQR